MKTYSLTANCKKCTYQTEQWNNVLSNGKHVRFEVTNYFYWGTFEIELTDNEKEEILGKDSIILNDYSVLSHELDSGCDYSDEICNIDNFTDDECREIHRLLYFDKNDTESYQNGYDDHINADTDVLEQNGWSMDETIYGMDTGCELECISENKDIELFLVEGLQGTSEEGWSFRFTEEFENKDDAYAYYDNIKLIPNKDIDRYEEQNNGVIGVQQKQIRNVNAKKIGNGIYEYDCNSSPIMTPECVTEDEEEDEEDDSKAIEEEVKNLQKKYDIKTDKDGIIILPMGSADMNSREDGKELVKLCVNMDCARYPPDWDFEEDTEDTYQEDQWKKCCLCDGYFNDNGMGDILFVQEGPNNQETECNLCGKSKDIVQIKGSGQYLCGNACDEEAES